MAKILLSYRRADSAAIAGRIFDRLVARYGATSVFMDVDNIPFGTDFREHIRETLQASDLLVAIVGPQWLGSRGQSRIKDSTDPVRIEIETALQARLPIVPVLVDGTDMPQPSDLPEALEKFCYLNAAAVASGRDFHHHVDRLIRSIDQILSAKTTPLEAATKAPASQVAATHTGEDAAVAPAGATSGLQKGTRRTVLIAGGGALAATGAAVFGWWYRPSTPPEPRSTSPAAKAPPATTPSPEEPIRIGIGAPLTGVNAIWGAQIKQGAEQARDDLNQSGGLLGKTIATVDGDDRGSSFEGGIVARTFASTGVSFVVGHFNSSVTLPVATTYQTNGILLITPASTSLLITELNMWNVFRTCGREDQQGVVAGDYIAKNFGNKKIALVHDKTTFGKLHADVTQKTLNARGLHEVLYESVNVGDKDFSALVAKIKSAGVDLVYWGGLHTEGGLLIRQMRERGVSALLMSGDGIATEDFVAIAGPSVEGTLMTLGPEVHRRPQARAVVERFRARRFEPEGYTLYSYAAVEIIKQAAEAANSLDPRKVADVMRSGRTFPTVLGDISYDRK